MKTNYRYEFRMKHIFKNKIGIDPYIFNFYLYVCVKRFDFGFKISFSKSAFNLYISFLFFTFSCDIIFRPKEHFKDFAK